MADNKIIEIILGFNKIRKNVWEYHGVTGKWILHKNVKSYTLSNNKTVKIYSTVFDILKYWLKYQNTFNILSKLEFSLISPFKWKFKLLDPEIIITQDWLGTPIEWTYEYTSKNKRINKDFETFGDLLVFLIETI